MPNKKRQKWQRPFRWPPSTWEFTPGMQIASDFVTLLIFVALLVTLAGAIIAWPVLITRTLEAIFRGTSEDVRNILLAVGALIGVPFLMWRTFIAAKQTEINRESHYTALFTKAVEQLGAEKTVKRRDFKPSYKVDDEGKQILEKGKPVQAISSEGQPLGEYETYELTVTNYEVRLGAIYALERIAQDSKRDATPIYLTLCAYLQNNSSPALEGSDWRPNRENDSDLVELIQVISRFAARLDEIPGYEFTNIHIPSIHVFENSMRELVFRNCTQKDVTISCDVSSLRYVDCRIDNMMVQETTAKYFHMIGGKVRYAKIFAVAIDDSVMLANFDTVVIHTSTMTNCRIEFGNEATQLLRAEFFECFFHGKEPFLYSLKKPHISETSFDGCTFLDCDLSFLESETVTFKNCEFKNCNVAMSKLYSPDEHRFVNCLTDADMELETDKISPHNVHQRWIEFRRTSAQKSLGA